MKKLFCATLLVLLSCTLLAPSMRHEVSGSGSTEKQIWFAEPMRDIYRKVLFNWISYISGITPAVKSVGSLSTNIADYTEVKLVIIPYFEGGLTSGQISTLEQYVNNGGSLFVGLRPDIIANAWFNTEPLGSYSPQGFVFPKNDVLDLSDIFQGKQVPNGIFASYRGPGYFSQARLPSTIVPVALDLTGKTVIYAGTIGDGKVVFLPSEWQWTIAVCYPCVYSPIMLRLLNYLVSSPIGLLRGMEQYVAIRFDDVYSYNTGLIAVDNVLRSLAITEVTYGVMPNYAARPELVNELGTMTGSEIAMHGDSSGHTDCYSYNYTTAYQRFSEGRQEVVGNYGVAPKWYFSPNNGPSNPEVEKALYDLSMNWSSKAMDCFNYFSNLRPSGIYDLSIVGELRFDEVSYWRSIVLFEYCRLLDSIPFVIMLHGYDNPAYLYDLLVYLQNRTVRFLTFSGILAQSLRTLDLSGAYTSEGFKPDLNRYDWAISEWDANITIVPLKSGRLFIRFNKVIHSAVVDGEAWAQFSNDTLVTPIINAGAECYISVTFGTPPPPPPPPPAGPLVSSPTHPDQDSWYNVTQVVLNWASQSESFPIVGYNYVIDHSSSTIPDAIVNTVENMAIFNLNDGEWWFHIRAVADATIWGLTTHFRLRIDTQPPRTTVTHSPGTKFAQIIAQDSHSGISLILIRTDYGQWQAFISANNVSVTFTGNSTHTIEAYSVDSAANVEISVANLTVNYLTVDTYPQNVDAPKGEGWYDANSTAYVSISSTTFYQFQFWYLDGQNQSVYSTASSVQVLMDAPHMITAEFIKTNAIFQDGFELGSFSMWNLTEYGTGCTAKIQNTTVHSGQYAAEYYVSNGAIGAYCHSSSYCLNGRNDAYFRVYMRLDTLGGNNGDDCFTQAFLDSSNIYRAYIRLTKSGSTALLSFGYYKGGSLVQTGTLETLQLNAWYCIEIHYRADSSTGAAEVWVNDSNIYSDLKINSGNYSLEKAVVGFDYSWIKPLDIYIDDVVVSDSYVGPTV